MMTMEKLGESAQENQTFQLSDGRKLGFAQYGDLKGMPLFYFHGTGNCRYEAGSFHEFGLMYNVQIIGVDRPSMGLSTRIEKRTLLDWPKDVNELADHLNIEKYAVVGISGGGPHALVCAHSRPERVTACAMVVPIGPRTPDAKGWTWKQGLMYDVYTKLPWAYRMLGNSIKSMMMQDSMDEKQVSRMPVCEADKKVYRETFPTLARISLEGSRNGFDGALQDLKLFVIKGSNPWGFDLSKLSSSINYSIWVGDQDDLYLHGKEMAELIPGCDLFEFPDLGHLSAVFENREAIIKHITGKSK